MILLDINKYEYRNGNLVLGKFVFYAKIIKSLWLTTLFLFLIYTTLKAGTYFTLIRRFVSDVFFQFFGKPVFRDCGFSLVTCIFFPLLSSLETSEGTQR